MTGTDEHGEKIALAAAARGMTPKQHCDSVVCEYKSLWQQVTHTLSCGHTAGAWPPVEQGHKEGLSNLCMQEQYQRMALGDLAEPQRLNKRAASSMQQGHVAPNITP